MATKVVRLRDVLQPEASDVSVLQFAHRQASLLVTCNREDFLTLAQQHPHHGIIIVIRRKTRAAERAALFRLLVRAGETGLQDNINFA